MYLLPSSGKGDPKCNRVQKETPVWYKMSLKKEKLKSKMLLQVHDELVFDALREEMDTLKPLILENMKAALPLPHGVPVEAEVGFGENWLEAH